MRNATPSSRTNETNTFQTPTVGGTIGFGKCHIFLVRRVTPTLSLLPFDNTALPLKNLHRYLSSGRPALAGTYRPRRRTFLTTADAPKPPSALCLRPPGLLSDVNTPLA